MTQQCKFCLKILAVYHFVTNCGHVFCRNCVLVKLDSSPFVVCGECDKLITVITDPVTKGSVRLDDVFVRKCPACEKDFYAQNRMQCNSFLDPVAIYGVPWKGLPSKYHTCVMMGKKEVEEYQRKSSGIGTGMP